MLAAQLAQIHAQSTNDLDLKAQKKAHSQSLLFDPLVAAAQDFDTIYQICYKGFVELCRLDPRFNAFAGNIFSEQSKQQDRTQMTAAQNQQLDIILDEYLRLVSSKLLLKPALKTVEWLVRRFRVHEQNTICLILSFLPFHTTPIFVTLLSIVPTNIPPMLKFLHPYTGSLVNPPRHTIVYTASNNRPFFAAWCTYVLDSNRLGYHHRTLTSFWASIATEAVASMLDQARSARLESQKQNQDDVVLLLLPILNEGLSPKGSPEFRIGCYMILTVLASKADLGDTVLVALMEAVTSDWTQTSLAGILCLSVLAQQRQNARLPKSVFNSVIALENLEEDLYTLRKQYRVERLALGLILGIVDGLKRTRNAERLRLLRTLLENGLMDEASTITAIGSVLSVAQTATLGTNPNFDVQGSLTDLVLRLADTKSIGRLVQTSMEVFDVKMGQERRELVKQSPSDETTSDQMIDVDMEDADNHTRTEDLELLASRIPTKTAYEISFLSLSDSYVFGSLAHAFIAVSASSTGLERFSNLPVLRKSLAMSEPLFLSFFMRIWCGNIPAIARAAAIQVVTGSIAAGPLTADVQIILPYLLFALADESLKVRRAAIELALALGHAYERIYEKDKELTDFPILGQKQVYGQGRETKRLSWLSMNETYRVLADLLVPGLEECLLDEMHIHQLISVNLNGSKYNKDDSNTRKELKTSLRLAIFSSLCSHVVNTPIYGVKLRLLHMLNKITKVGSASRTKLLLPLLSEVADETEGKYVQNCHEENIDPSQFLDEIVGITTAADRESIQTLKAIIEAEDQSRSPRLRVAALRHLQSIWSSLKPDLQASFARLLLEQVIGSPGRPASGDQGVEAIDLLRKVPLSTPILQSFVEGLPPILSTLQDKPPGPKRRRISQGQLSEVIDRNKMETLYIVRRINVVLDLVKGAKSGRHPQLMKGLFQVFSGLHHCSSSSSTATDYIQISAMESILAIIGNVEDLSSWHVDPSAIRADVLVDCIRAAEGPQVRNTALLLVSALATAAPELIIHSVMPVFTFMGTNLLHQDDDFSAYVVKQTMESVIPRLLQSLHKRKEGPFVGVTELLLSFVAAFEHIPLQRRLDIFHSLIEKVGAGDYLFALLVILLDRYPNDRKVERFALDLAARCDMMTRLLTIERYLQVILDLWKPKPTFSAPLLIIDGQRTAEDAVANLLPLAPMALSEASLVSVASLDLADNDENTMTMRRSYEHILKQVLLLSEHCNSNKKLEASCMQVLDAFLGLLPLSTLIETFETLLKRSEDSIRRQVLRSFEARLNDRKLDQSSSQTACLAFLPRLVSIIEGNSDVKLRQNTVSCVDRIIDKYGKKAPSAVVTTARTICGACCLGAAESSLRVLSLLCLTTMIEASRDMFISVIPKAFPKAIENLYASIKEDKEDKSLHNAAYSFLGLILIYIPWSITGVDLDPLLCVSYESANAEMGEACDQSRSAVLTLVPKRIEPKECFAALDRTWPSAVTEGPLAVKEYLEILRQAVDRQPKSTIVKHVETLGVLFLKMFDLRRIQLSPPAENSYDLNEIDEVEDLVNETAITMIYKLNDAGFRPLFLRLLGWTTSETVKMDDKTTIHRQTTWYRFLMKFFETLKSIVTNYAGLVIESSVQILRTLTPVDKDSVELWRRVICTLSKTFEHDQDDFYQAPAHFAPICTTLLNQLAHAAQLNLLSELIPAIAELAVVADSSIHHKEMNTAVLKYMRSHSAAVRLAAVQCERALTEKLGEEWLALLPEMLPFISEALEDDDESVEKEVQKWVITIERILGESLVPMLQ